MRLSLIALLALGLTLIGGCKNRQVDNASQTNNYFFNSDSTVVIPPSQNVCASTTHQDRSLCQLEHWISTTQTIETATTLAGGIYDVATIGIALAAPPIGAGLAAFKIVGSIALDFAMGDTETVLSENVRLFIEYSIDDFDNVRGATPEDLLEKSKIRDKLLTMATNSGLKPIHTAAILAAATKITAELTIQHADGQISLNRDKLQDLDVAKRDIKVLEKNLKEAAENLKFDQVALRKEIAKNIKGIKNKIEGVVEASPAIKQLNEKIDRLIALQEKDGQDRAQEIARLRAKAAQDYARYADKIELQKLHQSFDEIGHMGTILTSILSFSDPVAARKMQGIIQSGIAIGKGLSTIAAAALTNTAIGLGPYAAIAIAAVQIFTIISSDNGPPPEQIILETIIKLSQQVKQFEDNVHARFDRIEKIIGFNHTQIMNHFKNLHQMSYDSHRRVVNLQLAANTIQTLVGNLNSSLRTYVLESTQEPYFAERDWCLMTTLTETELRKCVKLFYSWTSRFSSQSILSGLKVNSDNTDISIDMEAFENTINTTASLAGETQQYANPIAWVDGWISYWRLIKRAPKAGILLARTQLDQMRAKGARISLLVKALQEKTIVTEVSPHLVRQFDALMIDLKKHLLVFVNRHYPEKRSKQVNTVLQRLVNVPSHAQSNTQRDAMIAAIKDTGGQFLDANALLLALATPDTQTTLSRYATSSPCATPTPITTQKVPFKIGGSSMSISGTGQATFHMNAPIFITAEEFTTLVPDKIRLLETLGYGTVSFCHTVAYRTSPTGHRVTTMDQVRNGGHVDSHALYANKISLIGTFNWNQTDVAEVIGASSQTFNFMHVPAALASPLRITAVRKVNSTLLLSKGYLDSHLEIRQQLIAAVIKETIAPTPRENARLYHNNEDVIFNKAAEAVVALGERPILAEAQRVWYQEEALKIKKNKFNNWVKYMYSLIYFSMNESYINDFPFRILLAENQLLGNPGAIDKQLAGPLADIKVVGNLVAFAGNSQQSMAALDTLFAKKLASNKHEHYWLVENTLKLIDASMHRE